MPVIASWCRHSAVFNRVASSRWNAVSHEYDAYGRADAPHMNRVTCVRSAADSTPPSPPSPPPPPPAAAADSNAVSGAVSVGDTPAARHSTGHSGVAVGLGGSVGSLELATRAATATRHSPAAAHAEANGRVHTMSASAARSVLNARRIICFSSGREV